MEDGFSHKHMVHGCNGWANCTFSAYGCQKIDF
jgi:hypothetical protein